MPGAEAEQVLQQVLMAPRRGRMPPHHDRAIVQHADMALTHHQVLVAYHRGRLAPDHGASGGLMAAVGLGAAAAAARLAKEGLAATVVGCDNSPVSVTLSGAGCPLAEIPVCSGGPGVTQHLWHAWSRLSLGETGAAPMHTTTMIHTRHLTSAPCRVLGALCGLAGLACSSQ